MLLGLGYVAAGALDLAGTGPGEEPFSRIRRVLSEGAVWRGTLWSLWVAAASTALAALAAITLAVAFRGRTGVDRIARAAAVAPLPLPHVVAGLIALLLLGQSGLIARGAHGLGLLGAPADMPALVYDRYGWGAILALVWKEIPFLVLVAFSVLARRGPELEEAARTLGATRRQAVRRITLPLLWRGMLPATIAVFVFAFGSYEIAALLAPSDPLALPLLMLERYTEPALDRRPDAFAIALLAMAVAALAVLVHEWLRAGWERFER